MTVYHEKNVGDDTPQFERMIDVAIDSALKYTWTALPGIVENFNANNQTATIQPAIKQGYYDQDNKIKYRSHPILINVPVHFIGGNGFSITYNLQQGDSGLIVFSSRSIDSWFEKGGEQVPEINRQHDFSDGMFIPGLRALPDKIQSFQTDGIQIRNASGNASIKIAGSSVSIDGDGIEIKDDGGTFFIKVNSSGVFLKGTILGDLNIGEHVHTVPIPTPIDTLGPKNPVI